MTSHRLRTRIVFRVTDDTAAQLVIEANRRGMDPSKLIRSLVADAMRDTKAAA